MAQWRSFLVLGRVAGLPTVWSNCLAGWWLGGGGQSAGLPFLFTGATLLYLGGVFLNDAFDVEFDRQHSKERPLPAGAISPAAVWCWGFTWLTLGTLCLWGAGTRTGLLGLLLVAGVLVYDAIHKAITLSPVLLGLCRFLLYLIAASTGVEGLTGWAIWCGLALAVYVTGLDFLARQKHTRGPLAYWPLLLLGTPILLALIMNGAGCREPALLLSGVLALWLVRSLRPTLWAGDRRIGRTISHLLAGIILVDLLAAADAPRQFSLGLLMLFGLTLLLQRFVPRR
jgi:hypothetical protein